MKWVELEWNSEKVKVPVQKIKGRLWFHLDGETHSVELQSGRRKSSGGGGVSSGAPGEIKAPMPGKILKVFVNAGDQVAVGQALIAMEAMKMEYTLEADQAGKVESLNASIGDQVALGELLVKIKGEEA